MSGFLEYLHPPFFSIRFFINVKSFFLKEEKTYFSYFAWFSGFFYWSNPSFFHDSSCVYEEINDRNILQNPYLNPN